MRRPYSRKYYDILEKRVKLPVHQFLGDLTEKVSMPAAAVAVRLATARASPLFVVLCLVGLQVLVSLWSRCSIQL